MYLHRLRGWRPLKWLTEAKEIPQLFCVI